jgi:cyclopropane-fatty-acyl-phospholipid synthase
VLGFARSVVFLINVMNDATSIPVAAPPPGISSYLAAFLSSWSARSPVPFRIVFANGAEFHAGNAEPAFTLRFRTRRAEFLPALFGHTALLEAYFAGELDVDGNFAMAFRTAMDAKSDGHAHPLVHIRNRWHEFRFSNASIAQAKANAEFHYDLPYDFYKLWLDRVGMMYTCAYWKEGTASLEEAQVNKMDHVCRKVQLHAGESFVDVGCGFGGLLFHAYEKYGALGTGINAASRQLADLRGEVERRGLSDRSSSSSATSARSPGSTTSCSPSARSSTRGGTSSTTSFARMRP